VRESAAVAASVVVCLLGWRVQASSLETQPYVSCRVILYLNYGASLLQGGVERHNMGTGDAKTEVSWYLATIVGRDDAATAGGCLLQSVGTTCAG
jgi:hypothetical protein